MKNRVFHRGQDNCLIHQSVFLDQCVKSCEVRHIIVVDTTRPLELNNWNNIVPVGKQFARREGGSYGDWSPKTAWDAPSIGKILDVRAAPDARSVLGARGVSRDRGLTASRRRGGYTSERGGRDA